MHVSQGLGRFSIGEESHDVSHHQKTPNLMDHEGANVPDELIPNA